MWDLSTQHSGNKSQKISQLENWPTQLTLQWVAEKEGYLGTLRGRGEHSGDVVLELCTHKKKTLL